MSDFKAKCTKFDFRDPAGELTVLPNHQPYLRGRLLRGGEERGREEEGEGWEREGREKRGEGKEGEEMEKGRVPTSSALPMGINQWLWVTWYHQHYYAPPIHLSHRSSVPIRSKLPAPIGHIPETPQIHLWYCRSKYFGILSWVCIVDYMYCGPTTVGSWKSDGSSRLADWYGTVERVHYNEQTRQ